MEQALPVVARSVASSEDPGLVIPVASRASSFVQTGTKCCVCWKDAKRHFHLFHLFVLCLSFSTVCLGALCVSISSSICRCGNIELIFYCLLALGIFLLVTGIFWSTFHEILKCRGSATPSFDLTAVESTMPDFYPPFHEDKTDPEQQSSLLPDAPILKQQEVTNIPSPLYSGSAEFISGTERQEQPLP
ncbi:transmembrane protein 252 [Heliangelus exortis]|uniref:transmembrane protein 252 n=1 Tax=Heliangelus exortis TaxID=472823 RepID=UPI003A8CD85A